MEDMVVKMGEVQRGRELASFVKCPSSFVGLIGWCMKTKPSSRPSWGVIIRTIEKNIAATGDKGGVAGVAIVAPTKSADGEFVSNGGTKQPRQTLAAWDDSGNDEKTFSNPVFTPVEDPTDQVICWVFTRARVCAPLHVCVVSDILLSQTPVPPPVYHPRALFSVFFFFESLFPRAGSCHPCWGECSKRIIVRVHVAFYYYISFRFLFISEEANDL